MDVCGVDDMVGVDDPDTPVSNVDLGEGNSIAGGRGHKVTLFSEVPTAIFGGGDSGRALMGH